MALILTRRKGEVLVVGENTRVTVLGFRGNYGVFVQISSEIGGVSEQLRKIGEPFEVGDATLFIGEITSFKGANPQARIVIEAPRDVSVDRLEVRERKNSDNPGGKVDAARKHTQGKNTLHLKR